MEHIRYNSGELHIEGVAISTLAEQYPTPFYCYSTTAIQEQFQNFSRAFKNIPSLICYALKVNSNQAILSLLAKEGAGADVVSEGELRRALAAGIPAQKIVFSGVAKTDQEIRFALCKDILCFNVESEPELRTISAIASELQLTARISLRINPDIDAKTHAKISTGKSENKFGIPYKNAVTTYQLASQLPNVEITGIDMHIGSQVTKISSFDAAIARLVEIISELKNHNINIRHIDVGGGLGVAYQSNHKPEKELLCEYAAVIHKYSSITDCQFIFEPGRFIVANAGVLVTRTVYVKPVESKCFVIVDAAMNDLIRPTLYDAWHDIEPVKKIAAPVFTKTDIVGPVCESGDYLALDRDFPQVSANDLLAIKSTGAYSAVTSNTYNTRRLIAEVLVKNNDSHLIRKSPSYDELIGLDSVPQWCIR